MLKIRLQGTVNDIRWFLKILERDNRFITNNPSESMDIKESVKFKRAYTEIFRDKTEYEESKVAEKLKKGEWSCSTGTVCCK